MADGLNAATGKLRAGVSAVEENRAGVTEARAAAEDLARMSSELRSVAAQFQMA